MAGKRKIVESCVESWLKVLARYIGILKETWLKCPPKLFISLHKNLPPATNSGSHLPLTKGRNLKTSGICQFIQEGVSPLVHYDIIYKFVTSIL